MPDRPGSGFVWWMEDEAAIDRISRSVEYEATFTDSVPTVRVRIGRVDLTLLVFQRQRVAMLGLVSPTPGRTTATKKVIVTDVIQLDILFEELWEHLSRGAQEHMPADPQVTAWRPAEDDWQSLVQAVKEMRPDLVTRIEALQERRDSPEIDFDLPGAEQQFVERDVLGVALQFAGIAGQRREVFAALTLPELGADSIYQHLGGGIDEDSIIAYDLRRFADLVQVEDRGNVCRFSSGSREVVVYNFNRQQGERATGVDVVYWNRHFDAFTFVQYKMLEREGGGWVYRPNEHFVDQCALMRGLGGAMGELEAILHARSYRHAMDPFLIKFCRRDPLVMDSADMAMGMYVPLSYYDVLEGVGALTTPQNATVVTHDRVERWLNRTEFATMLKWGWLGTRGVSDQWLQRYIEGVLAQGRELVIADSRSRPLHQRRD